MNTVIYLETWDISYDTDGQKVKLPKKITFAIPVDLAVDLNSDEVMLKIASHYEDVVADMISDHTGFCVNGCSFDIVTEKDKRKYNACKKKAIQNPTTFQLVLEDLYFV